MNLYTVRIPNWHVGQALIIANIEADSPEQATAKVVAWVNRRANYHYCDSLPPGSTVRQQTEKE